MSDFDTLRAWAARIEVAENVLKGMRKHQVSLIIDAKAAQMPAKRIAEASHLTVGRIYQILKEANDG